ncbi:MAG TPA: hypothetical protein VFW09_16190 [Solirubrobacteraceae bacterium]|nr:hypothetical protein [Solirubrobacteraceae bacterium]
MRTSRIRGGFHRSPCGCSCRAVVGQPSRQQAVQEQRRLMFAVVGADVSHEQGRHGDEAREDRDVRSDGYDRHDHHDGQNHQGRGDE